MRARWRASWSRRCRGDGAVRGLASKTTMYAGQSAARVSPHGGGGLGLRDPGVASPGACIRRRERPATVKLTKASSRTRHGGTIPVRLRVCSCLSR
jgi:hypothetical protein